MKSLKKKKNRNGMTLVEVVIAMTVFSVACAMIAMTLGYAARSVGSNYQRSDDVNAEGVFAETYNPDEAMAGQNVERNNITGQVGSNEVQLGANFTLSGGNESLKVDNVYAYKSKLNGRKKDIAYQLQFFKTKDNYLDIVDPANGKFVVRLYNNTSSDIVDWKFTTNTSSYLFDTQGQMYSQKDDGTSELDCGMIVKNGGCTGVGISIPVGGTVTIGTTSGTPSGTINLSSANLSQYAEKDSSGNYTGVIYIHFEDGNFYNQTEYEQKHLND